MTQIDKLDPVAEFHEWFEEAKQTGLKDPNAMALATLGKDGMPHVRMVLMKEFDARGVVFFTNTSSAKAQDLEAQPLASVCFFWQTTRKQVRVQGRVTAVSEQEADAYFATRPRDSQLGAWASLQSQSMASRAEFEARLTEVSSRYEGQEVPRPPHWSGYRISLEAVEFWIEKPYRLHDRYLYLPQGSGWKRQLLYP